jgi:hypothetical protein
VVRTRPGGVIGSHSELKPRFPQGSTGSNPVPGTWLAREEDGEIARVTRIDLHKTAPQLVSLAKTAAVSLAKNRLAGHRAAVYLVVDHSGSMRPFYADGSVQRLAERALALSVNVDDDGLVPLIVFSTEATLATELDLTSYAGALEAAHRPLKWGTTNYVAAIDAVVEHYQAVKPGVPGLVVFQTDGGPDSRRATADAMRAASKLPLFWAFVGFGERVDFLARLDELPHRIVDNASHLHAHDPNAVTDEALYDALLGEYGDWLRAAQEYGILDLCTG